MKRSIEISKKCNTKEKQTSKSNHYTPVPCSNKIKYDYVVIFGIFVGIF